MSNVIDIAYARREKEVHEGFKDNDGRTWIKCGDKDPRGIWWNLKIGRVKCRLKFPHEENSVAIEEN